MIIGKRKERFYTGGGILEKDPMLEGPQISLGDIRRKAKPLYDAWHERYKRYGAVFYLGEKRSFEETVKMFETLQKALISNQEAVLKHYSELREVYQVASKLLNLPPQGILEKWKEIFEEGVSASVLREALTAVGFHLAIRYERGYLPLRDAVDLYHFYTEVGLRKTAHVLSVSIMSKIDPAFLSEWKSLESEMKMLKKEYKELLSDALKKNNMSFYIHGRIKSPYSSYQKMARKKYKLENVPDLLGLEVLVPEECLENALRVVVGRLKKTERAIKEIENYHPLSLDVKLLQEIYGKHFDYEHRPREDGYHSIHITLEGGVEIKVTPVEKKALEQEGPIRHTLYKKKIEVDEAKEAAARTLRIWEKEVELVLKMDDGMFRGMKLDSEEFQYLPIDVFFDKGLLIKVIQDMFPEEKNIVLEITKSKEEELKRAVATAGLKNKTSIRVTLEGKVIHTTQSKKVVEIVHVVVE